jgi:hypothetical protein
MMKTTKRDDGPGEILSIIATTLLHLLALPFVLIAGIVNLRRLVRLAQRLNAGVITCPYCAAVNPLNLMTRCPTCGAVEPGSRLRCSFCDAVYDVIPCGGCGATLRVP